MTGYRYERAGYTFERPAPMTDAELDAAVINLERRIAHRQIARQMPRDPTWIAEDVIEKFGGDVFRPLAQDT